MSPHDALESGAFPQDIAPADFPVPGGETDPMWLYAAHHLCPPGNRTFRQGWMTGFVAALEAMRGFPPEPGLADVLKDSVLGFGNSRPTQ